MQALLESLVQLLVAVWDVVFAAVSVVVPWLGLIAWIAFWLFAVNWTKLRALLLQGGWIGLLLLGFGMILVWWAVAPPPNGHHLILGLTLSNFVGKTVYVTILMCIMLLCGSVQLSGMSGPADDDEEDAALAHASH